MAERELQRPRAECQAAAVADKYFTAPPTASASSTEGAALGPPPPGQLRMAGVPRSAQAKGEIY
eukprot:8364187-Pyramimonas_sp.AAC.1